MRGVMRQNIQSKSKTDVMLLSLLDFYMEISSGQGSENVGTCWSLHGSIGDGGVIQWHGAGVRLWSATGRGCGNWVRSHTLFPLLMDDHNNLNDITMITKYNY